MTQSARSAYWLEVSVVCDGEAAEVVAEVLRPLAHGEGVVLEQRADAGALGEDALEPEVTVKIFLPAAHDTSRVRRRIREALYYLGRLYPIPAPTFRKLEDKDWAQAWKEHYEPFRVGERLWIQPSWVQDDRGHDPETVVLRLDPGMAFGTGLHPTTQMCLKALERLVGPEERVLDVGTGSGILAIAAARLGAGYVLAVDTDPQAVASAGANVEQNGVVQRVEVRRGSLSEVEPGGWDLVVVNILAPVIVKMLSEDGLCDFVSAGGALLLSGIIDRQLPDVESALAAAGAFVTDSLSVRDWVTLLVRRDPHIAAS